MFPIQKSLQRCCFALLLAGCLASSLYARQLPHSASQGLPMRDDDPIHFEHLTTSDGLSSNLITTVLQGYRGYLWFGTWGGGLVRYDGYEGKAYRHVEGDSTSLSYDVVRAIHESNEGVLWIGTEGGLNRFDPVAETFHSYRHQEGDPASLSDDRVRVIHESNDGVLWIGTDGGGLNRFDPVAETFRSYRHQEGDPASLSHDQVWAIHESNDGVLWIGTDGGLDRLKGTTASDPDSLSFARVSAETTSLDGSGVRSITEDEEGQLWLGQSNGRLARFNPETGHVRYFGKRHGLPLGSFTTALRSRAGSFYWGNVSGLITFRFEDLPPLGEPPRVHLSELWLFNEVLTPGLDSPLERTLSETQAVHFTHDQNDVTIGFV